MEYILTLTFANTDDEKSSLIIDGVRSDLTKEEISSLMDTIITNKINKRKDLKHMNIISKKIQYVSHDLNTRFHACKTYSSNTYSVKDICRLYHCSKASLMRWSLPLRQRLNIFLLKKAARFI